MVDEKDKDKPSNTEGESAESKFQERDPSWTEREDPSSQGSESASEDATEETDPEFEERDPSWTERDSTPPENGAGG